MARRVLLASEMDRPHVQHDARRRRTSGCRRSSSTCCSSRSISSGWRACRGAFRTTPCSSPTGTWCPRSAASVFGSVADPVRHRDHPMRARRQEGERRVWDGATPTGLEWTLPSPPPYHSFTDRPGDQMSATGGAETSSAASATRALVLHVAWRWRFISASSRLPCFAVITDGSRWRRSESGRRSTPRSARRIAA